MTGLSSEAIYHNWDFCEAHVFALAVLPIVQDFAAVHTLLDTLGIGWHSVNAMATGIGGVSAAVDCASRAYGDHEVNMKGSACVCEGENVSAI